MDGNGERKERTYVFHTGYHGAEFRGGLSLQRDLAVLFASVKAKSVKREEKQEQGADVYNEEYEIRGHDGRVLTKAKVAVTIECIVTDVVERSVDGSVVLSLFDNKQPELVKLGKDLRDLAERYNLLENER